MLLSHETSRMPTLEGLEGAAEILARELGMLLERARENERALQDADAECEMYSPVRARVSRDQRRIARMLTRAHSELVHSDDERHGAARRVYAYAVEADRSDGSWHDDR